MTLLIVGQMIYISYQINKTERLLDESILQINEEIYPKEVADHLIHLLQQLEQLDRYTVGSKEFFEQRLSLTHLSRQFYFHRCITSNRFESIRTDLRSVVFLRWNSSIGRAE